MSTFESMSGYAKLKGADFKELRKELIIALNKDIEGIRPCDNHNVNKPNTRSFIFDIPQHYKGDKGQKCVDAVGTLTMNKEKNEVEFEIDEGNRAYHDSVNTNFLKTLFAFFEKMPQVGKVYGAETAYSSEYRTDAYGHRTPSYTRYGAWAEKPSKRNARR